MRDPINLAVKCAVESAIEEPNAYGLSTLQAIREAAIIVGDIGDLVDRLSEVIEDYCYDYGLTYVSANPRG